MNYQNLSPGRDQASSPLGLEALRSALHAGATRRRGSRRATMLPGGEVTSMDYGHELAFGYFLVPQPGDPQGDLETARLVDRLGYDLIGSQDHPYQPRFFDTLALMGWILALADFVRVFADVHVHDLRP